MFESSFKNKIISRFRYIVLTTSSKLGVPYFPYRSYWHMIFTPPRLYNTDNMYFSAVPNRGAGIGHQLANWIAGLWFSKLFELEFAHIPFSSQKWEDYFGFGRGCSNVEDLIQSGYKIRRLPKFYEYDLKAITTIKKIIASYYGEKIVFLAEQDQFYKDQYGVMDCVREKFYSSDWRKSENIQYDRSNYNIAIHIRRGDILKDTSNPNLSMRYLANDYYYKVLCHALRIIKTDKPIHIWLFSQGKREDYPEFNKMSNLHWCLNMDPQDSFTHMVFADMLITSKSSFSYKPALLSKGIKISPQNFWHSYPNTPDWIMTDDDGNLLNEV